MCMSCTIPRLSVQFSMVPYSSVQFHNFLQFHTDYTLFSVHTCTTCTSFICFFVPFMHCYMTLCTNFRPPASLYLWMHASCSQTWSTTGVPTLIQTYFVLLQQLFLSLTCLYLMLCVSLAQIWSGYRFVSYLYFAVKATIPCCYRFVPRALCLLCPNFTVTLPNFNSCS